MNSFYIYGVVATDTLKQRLPLGLQEREVELYAHQTINLLMSPYQLAEGETVHSSRQNLLAHQKITEAALSETTIIPFKFGTIMQEDELQSFLAEQEQMLQNQLKAFENKVEFSLKGFWTDMPQVFAQILEQQPEIKAKQQALAKMANPPQNELIEIGKMVEAALDMHKAQIVEDIISVVQPVILQSKVNENIMESMFANLALLIEREQESALDALINKAAENFGEQAKFKYLGPSAPVNFVNLVF